MLVAKTKSDPCGDTTTQGPRVSFSSLIVLIRSESMRHVGNCTRFWMIVKWRMLLFSFSQINRISRGVSDTGTVMSYCLLCFLATSFCFEFWLEQDLSSTTCLLDCLALTPEEIPDKLGLHRIRDRNWYVLHRVTQTHSTKRKVPITTQIHAYISNLCVNNRYVQPCVARTGDGLNEGLTWLSMAAKS